MNFGFYKKEQTNEDIRKKTSGIEFELLLLFLLDKYTVFNTPIL